MLLFLIHFFHIQVKQMILSIVSSLHPVWICNCFFEGVHFLFHVVDYKIHLGRVWGFSDSSVGKESTCYAGDPSSIPGSGKSSEEGIGYPLQCARSSLVAQLVKNLPAMWETWVESLGWEDPQVGKIPWRREWLPTPVFLPGESHGQRSLVGYSSQDCKESDRTEWLTLSQFMSMLGRWCICVSKAPG